MSLSRSFALANGQQIPALGLGTWRAAPGEVGGAVEAALAAGYRHIDAAAIYGNEKEVGQAIKNSGVPRKDIWITSKLWNDSHGRVAAALDQTLADLGVDYLDLYLIHWPAHFTKGADGKELRAKTDFAKVWAELEKQVDAGKVKSLGVSNFRPSHIEEVLRVARIKPVVNQVEVHPYFQQKELLAFCASKQIHVTAYCPLGGGYDPKVLDDAVIGEIAKKHGVAPAVVILSWGVLRGTSVIPKSVSAARVRANADFVELSTADIAAIDGIAYSKRHVEPAEFWGPECAFITSDA